MKKIRLDLDALEVVSFATDGEREAPRGTVHGRDVVGGPSEGEMNSFNYQSCAVECATYEYRTCQEAGPSVGPSCDYMCFLPSLGCYPYTEAPTCAETCA